MNLNGTGHPQHVEFYFELGKNDYTVGEKLLFDPLLILYICPLTKKWSIYNFNGRFILSET